MRRDERLTGHRRGQLVRFPRLGSQHGNLTWHLSTHRFNLWRRRSLRRIQYGIQNRLDNNTGMGLLPGHRLFVQCGILRLVFGIHSAPLLFTIAKP